MLWQIHSVFRFSFGACSASFMHLLHATGGRVGRGRVLLLLPAAQLNRFAWFVVFFLGNSYQNVAQFVAAKKKKKNSKWEGTGNYFLKSFSCSAPLSLTPLCLSLSLSLSISIPFFPFLFYTLFILYPFAKNKNKRHFASKSKCTNFPLCLPFFLTHLLIYLAYLSPTLSLIPSRLYLPAYYNRALCRSLFSHFFLQL